MGSIQITAELQPRGPAAAFVLTDEQVAAVGEGARRFPARAEINGTLLRTTVTRMRGEFLFGLSRASRASREAAGVQAGDTVTFVLERDDAPREVEIPPALAGALATAPAAQRAFDALAYTHRKEFAQWVQEAKREETRDRRIAETLRMLAEGRTRS